MKNWVKSGKESKWLFILASLSSSVGAGERERQRLSAGD